MDMYNLRIIHQYCLLDILFLVIWLINESNFAKNSVTIQPTIACMGMCNSLEIENFSSL
jgi:hypothetical protein